MPRAMEPPCVSQISGPTVQSASAIHRGSLVHFRVPASHFCFACLYTPSLPEQSKCMRLLPSRAPYCGGAPFPVVLADAILVRMPARPLPRRLRGRAAGLQSSIMLLYILGSRLRARWCWSAEPPTPALRLREGGAHSSHQG